MATMFDSIINEAETKFNLQGKGGALLSALLTLMTDRTRGGLTGFLERFNAAGLRDTAASWVNSGANTAVSGEQIESALGTDAISRIADQAGTDLATTTAATAFMTPRVVDAMTPDGTLLQDDDLMTHVGGYLDVGAPQTTAETFDRIGTAATDTIDANNRAIVGDRFDASGEGVRGIGARTGDALNRVDADFDDRDDSPLKWLLPLILLGLLLAVGYWFCGKSPEPAVKTHEANTAVNKANTNAAVNAANTNVMVNANTQ